QMPLRSEAQLRSKSRGPLVGGQEVPAPACAMCGETAGNQLPSSFPCGGHTRPQIGSHASSPGEQEGIRSGAYLAAPGKLLQQWPAIGAEGLDVQTTPILVAPAVPAANAGFVVSRPDPSH